MPTQIAHLGTPVENNPEAILLDTSETRSITAAPEIENEPDPV